MLKLLYAIWHWKNMKFDQKKGKKHTGISGPLTLLFWLVIAPDQGEVRETWLFRLPAKKARVHANRFLRLPLVNSINLYIISPTFIIYFKPNEHKWVLIVSQGTNQSKPVLWRSDHCRISQPCIARSQLGFVMRLLPSIVFSLYSLTSNM